MEHIYNLKQNKIKVIKLGTNWQTSGKVIIIQNLKDLAWQCLKKNPNVFISY